MRNYNLDKFADMHIHMTKIDFLEAESYLNFIAKQNLTDFTLQSLTYRAICYNLSVLYWKKNHSQRKGTEKKGLPEQSLDMFIYITYSSMARNWSTLPASTNTWNTECI